MCLWSARDGKGTLAAYALYAAVWWELILQNQCDEVLVVCLTKLCFSALDWRMCFWDLFVKSEREQDP